MTTTFKRSKPHFQRSLWDSHTLGRPDVIEWRLPPRYGSYYNSEDELLDQLNRLPSNDEVQELCSSLRAITLREFSSEIVNGSIDHLRQKLDRREYVRLLNSWIATAEETLAAGENAKRIAARRKK